ncbi:MAG TPA: MBL fold metallo-hydrolase [Paracoccaceae bacterium]|nr:MBL fold metallo-hydrolase [Paracoccaceae bacterium]
MTAAAPLRYPFADPPAEGAAVEVAPGILWMRLPLPMALNHVNVYALDDGEAGWSLVDTALSSGRARTLWQVLLDGPLAGRPVHRVIVTHHHPDHIGNAGWFQARGAVLVATRTAWLYARMLTLDVQDRPTPEAVAFWRAAGMDAGLLARRLGERPFNFADVVAPLPLGLTRFADGDRLQAAGHDWTVRTGGGHAPEHATLWSDDGLVIGGDQFLPGISPNIGVYPTEPAADPLADWLASCAAFADHARDDHLVLPGHRLPFLGLPGRLAQMQAGHAAAPDRLRAHLMAAPASAVDCFAPLYGRSIGDGEYGLALAEAVAHLYHLAAAGAVRADPGLDGALLWRPA